MIRLARPYFRDVMMLCQRSEVLIELAHAVAVRLGRHLGRALFLASHQDLIMPPLRRRAPIKRSVLGFCLYDDAVCHPSLRTAMQPFLSCYVVSDTIIVPMSKHMLEEGIGWQASRMLPCRRRQTHQWQAQLRWRQHPSSSASFSS